MPTIPFRGSPSETRVSTETDNYTRIYGILARNAPVGILFRRGPSKRVRLIKWHTTEDRFELGQWFHGRIYEKRCDLSPDGSLLIYFAAKHRPGVYSWTAISRPPFLTALSLWQKGDSWWGGGLFEGDRRIWLNHRPDEVEAAPPAIPPVGWQVRANPDAIGEDGPIETRRWMRDGWQCRQELDAIHVSSTLEFQTRAPALWFRDHATLPLVLECRIAISGFKQRREYRVLRASGETVYEVEDAEWTDWDQNGRLVFGSGGKLVAVRFSASRAVDEMELADFSAMQPEPIETPEWAKKW